MSGNRPSGLCIKTINCHEIGPLGFFIRTVNCHEIGLLSFVSEQSIVTKLDELDGLDERDQPGEHEIVELEEQGGLGELAKLDVSDELHGLDGCASVGAMRPSRTYRLDRFQLGAFSVKVAMGSLCARS